MRIICFGGSNTFGSGLDDPENAWPNVLGKLENCEIVNKSRAGSSNLEILYEILKFNFQPDDKAVILWVPPYRDYMFDPEQQMGAWVDDSELKTNWMLAHSNKDLVMRNWFYISHANDYLNNNKIVFINSAETIRDLNKYKPKFKLPILSDIKMDRIKFFGDKASDNVHPGIKSHIKIATKFSTLLHEH